MFTLNLEEVISKSFDTQSYQDFFEQLVVQKKTTGIAQTKFMIDYTANNLLIYQEMKSKISEENIESLSSKITEDVIWLFITEPWCSDAAFSSPVFFNLAANNSKINLRILLRDENIELMNCYLTDGKSAIPKLIAINPTTLEVLYTWGPRPKLLSKIIEKEIEQFGTLHINQKINLAHNWYKENNQKDLFSELTTLIK